MGGLLIEKMLASRGRLKRIRQGRGFKPKVKKASPGNFHLFAPFADVEFGQYVCGELPWIHLSLLSEGHERRSLVIPKFRVRTRADLDEIGIGIRQHSPRSIAQTLF